MRRFVRGGRWFVLAALALGGCTRGESSLPWGDQRGPEVSLRLADEKDLAAVLMQQRGKVVLVEFWATWCIPCLELLPHTLGLQQRFDDRGLVVVTVSFDSPRQQAAALEVLRSRQARGANLLSRYGSSPRSVEAFQAGDGALPYLKLYDRQGHLSKTFGLGGDEPPEPQVIDRAVEALLPAVAR